MNKLPQPQTETAPVTPEATETQHLTFNDEGMGKVGYVSAAVVAGSLVLGGYALWNKWDPWGDVKGAFTQHAPKSHTEIAIKTIAIDPVTFDCRSLHISDASGSSAVTYLHGFPRGLEAKEATPIMMTCLPEGATKITDGPVDPQTHTRTKDITINADKMRFHTWLHDSDTDIVLRNGGPLNGGGTVAKETLTAGANIVDYALDGTCQLVTIGHCDKGVPNPADKAVSMSHEDDGKSEQAFRVAIADKTQTVCAPQEFAREKAAVETAYIQAGAAQGASSTMISVHWVDNNGMPLSPSYVPNYTKDWLAKQYADGSLSPVKQDIIKDKNINVSCTPLSSPIMEKNLDFQGQAAPN